MNVFKQRYPWQSSVVLVVLAIAMMSLLYPNGMIPPTETLFDIAVTYGKKGNIQSRKLLNGSNNVMIIGNDDHKTAEVARIMILL